MELLKRLFRREELTVEEVFRRAGLQPRPHQLETAKLLLQQLEACGRVALTAPTGWGKTLVTLAALRVGGYLPILWLVRTISLARHVEDEAALLGLRSTTLLGKGRVCPYRSRVSDVYAYCRYNRAVCPFFQDLLRHGADHPTACPYYAAEVEAIECDVIVQSYHRRRVPCDVTVVDEAHNVLAPRSFKIYDDEVGFAWNALKEYAGAEVAEEVRGILFSPAPRVERLRQYEVEIKEALAEMARRMPSSREFRALAKLYRATRALALNREAGAGYVEAFYRPIRVRDPAVFVSATLPSRACEVLNAPVIRVPGRRRVAYVLSWLTSRYGQETIREYSLLLKMLRLKLGRIVAFTSERLAVKFLDIADYYEADLSEIPGEWSGLMLLHSRGRFSEGVDIPAPCVVIVGCPFLPPSVSRKLSKVWGRGAGALSMSIVTLQNIGRAVRSPEHEPLILLADERFMRHRELFEEYLELQPLESREQLVKIVEDFKARLK